MDEVEANLIGVDYDVDEIVITNGSHGSRIICGSEVRIDALHCDNVVDTTESRKVLKNAHFDKIVEQFHDIL